MAGVITSGLDAQSTDNENGCQAAGGREVPSTVALHLACSAVRRNRRAVKHDKETVKIPVEHAPVEQYVFNLLATDFFFSNFSTSCI